MKKSFIILFYLFFSASMHSQNNAMVAVAPNYSSFAVPVQSNITTQLSNQTPASYQNNPEYGVLPLNAPCDQCVELIHKRTDYAREYVEGTKRYSQTGYNKINYVDSNGYYREIDYYLYPTSQSDVFASLKQPVPTYVDAGNKKLVINYDGNRFEFARNLKLIFQDSLNVKSTLALADWSHVSIGKEGVFVTDIFPNIDFEARVMEGSFKTSFIIKAAQTVPTKGWLIVSDDLNSNFAPAYNFSALPDVDGKVNGNLFINAPNNKNFAILQGLVASSNRGNYVPLYYRMISNTLEMLTNSTWLNDTATKYPLSIDPAVTNAGTLAQASITGSGLNNSGTFVGFCSYNLTVARPANCTINGVTWSFNYIAQNGAVRNEGAIDFLHGACRSPAGAGFFWFCNVATAGACNGANVATGTDLTSCISPIAACSGNLTFTMRFYDRFAGAACSNLFIGANSAWTMTLLGNDLQTLGNTASGNGATTQAATCYASTNMNPAVTSGVPGYTYLWSNGATSSTLNYMPTAPGSTVFTCNVTDACGVSRVATFTITNNCVLPIELKDYTATYTGNYTNLKWSTATEKNADYFTIERSANGIDYVLLEKVPASLNSASLKNYGAKDYSPNKKGTNYYRLKQFDVGDKEKFSKVITVDINEEALEVKLVPNPASTDLDIELSNNCIGKTVNIELYDVMGKKYILKQNIHIDSETKTTHLNLSELPKGIFFINVITEDFTVYKNKLIKL